MKTTKAFAALFLAFVWSLAAAEPVSFEELSLMIRLGESADSIHQTIFQRRLFRPLTSAQESTLKGQGATEALLKVLRDSSLLLPEAEAKVIEERRARARQEAKPAGVPAAETTPATAKPSVPVSTPAAVDVGPKSGRRFVIERIRIIRDPIPQPYYVHIHAKAGRSEATFFQPGKIYGSGLTQTEISIPLNLVLNDVQLNTSAVIELHIDSVEANVTSYKSLTKHIARIVMRERGPVEETFVPALFNTPFSYILYFRVE